MIKNYKEYIKESLLDKIEGPTEKEIWDIFKHMTPQQMLEKSIKIDFIPGIIRAIKIGADMFQNNFYFTRIKKLLNIDDSNKEEMFKYIKLLKEPNKILIYSIRYDILEGVKLALKMGANKDNINSYNPLINCISDNKNDIAIYLISQGADIHFNDDEPIYIASMYSNFKMIKKLVDLGCDINTKDGYLMRYAIQYQALVNIKFLLYIGFDLFKNDDSIQFELAEMKNIDLIKLNNEVKLGKYDKDMEFILD